MGNGYARGPEERHPMSLGIRSLRWGVVAAFAACFVYYVVVSFHWPLMWDSIVMHYVRFLMSHGLKPYSEITDQNMPGAYLTEGWAMAVFGGGDVAWRIYEFFLLLVMAGAMMVIARPYDWVGGLYGAGVFFALHAAEGPKSANEREEVIAALLIVGYAAMFTAMRRRMPGLMLVFGLACALAISIKPTYLLLPVALMILLFCVLRREQRPAWAYVGWSAAGFLVVGALLAAFLLPGNGLGKLIAETRLVMPVYAGMMKMGPYLLIRTSVPKYLLPLALLGCVLAVSNWKRFGAWNWEQWALAIAVAVGYLSYFVQDKGYVYHRYLYLLFGLLIVGMEAMRALRGEGWPRGVAIALLLVTILGVLPAYMLKLHRTAGDSPLTLAMERDLNQLGDTSEMQQKIQCFDMTFGCLSALYHLKLVGNNGYTGDMLFFPYRDNSATTFYREEYWSLMAKSPASVLVISNQDFQGGPNSFVKLDRWPAFEDYLRTNYTEVVERTFPREGVASNEPPLWDPEAYRIYVRDGSPLLAKAAALQTGDR
jgi:hypothetical protein